MSVSANSLCPSSEGCPNVFSNPCIARDLCVSMSGIHFSFMVEHLATLGIPSPVEGEMGAGWGAFHIFVAGYSTASDGAGFSPDRKDRCQGSRPVPRHWERVWHPQEESGFEILSFPQSSNALPFFWCLKFSLRRLCVYFLVFFFP